MHGRATKALSVSDFQSAISVVCSGIFWNLMNQYLLNCVLCVSSVPLKVSLGQINLGNI